MKKEITELQKLMREEGIDVYYVPEADPHGSEMVNDHYKSCEFLSGLLRENGFSEHDFFLAGDTAFNVFNSGTALFWSGKLDSLAILPELDPGEQKTLAERFPE